jgi:hypothetical protein
MLRTILWALAAMSALAFGIVLLLIYKLLFVLTAGIGLVTAYFVSEAERTLERESEA